MDLFAWALSHVSPPSLFYYLLSPPCVSLVSMVLACPFLPSFAVALAICALVAAAARTLCLFLVEPFFFLFALKVAKLPLAETCVSSWFKRPVELAGKKGKYDVFGILLKNKYIYSQQDADTQNVNGFSRSSCLFGFPPSLSVAHPSPLP